MAAGPLFIVVEKNVKPSHGTQEKGLKCTEKKIYKIFSIIEFLGGSKYAHRFKKITYKST